MRTQVTPRPSITIALFFTLLLTIIPLPAMVTACRPPWVLLMMLYIQFWLPQYFRVVWVLLFGLGLDVLLGTTLGEHALAMLLTLWLATSKTRRFLFFSTLQQMVLVLFFCLIYQSMLYLLDAAFGYNNSLIFIFGPAILGTFAWPWVKYMTDKI